MSHDLIDELLDGVPEAELLAQRIEQHLDHHPLPVDTDEVEAVVRGIQARVGASPPANSNTSSSTLWYIGAAVIAIAAATLVFALPPTRTEVGYSSVSNARIATPEASLSIDHAPPSPTTPYQLLDAPGVHPLAASERSLDIAEDSLVHLSQRGKTAVARVERGSLISDGTLVTAGLWILCTRSEGIPYNVVFRDGERPPVLPSVWENTEVDEQLRSLRWRVLAETGLAASRDDLRTRAAIAKDQLHGCTKGCDRPVGARASATLLAYRYLTTGIADPELSANVAGLDPLLFTRLAPVLRDARGTASDWARLDATYQAAKEAYAAYEAERPPEPPPLEDRKPRPLEITVVDPKGNIIPTAIVRFPIERQRHRVNTQTGVYIETVLYLPDGSEKLFTKDSSIAIEVMAPNFQRQEITYTLERRRKNKLRVVLQPRDYVASDEASPQERKALRAAQEWSEAEALLASSYSDATLNTTNKARKKAVEASMRWVKAGGGDEALELCRSLGELAECGL